MLQNATPLRKSAPWPPNISHEHVSCTHLPPLLKMLSCFAHFWQGAESLVPATQNDIRTSKSVPTPSVFSTFDFEMLLRATTACTFSTSQLPKVLRTWGAFRFFTSKCASCHNGVQLFISHLAKWLRTRRFSEPTFRPSGATNHWKNTLFSDFATFSSTCIFCLLTLSLPCSFSSFLLFSDSSHLCFSSVHIVGSLTLCSIYICMKHAIITFKVTLIQKHYHVD